MDLENPVKRRLSEGKTVFGCFIPQDSATTVEILALAGFDFVLLDAEHGPISPESAYPMILAAEAHGIPAFARIGQNDKQVILKFLDLGIAGVMVPQINNAAQAEQAVAATKFAPRGTRGLAGGRAFEFGLKRSAPEMVRILDDRVLTIIQFEHRDALADLDAILAVPDLDVLFVGPNDLAQSLGFPGQPGHPDVTRMGDEVVARAKARGVKVGTVAPDSASAIAAIERGFDMIVANSPGLLAGAAKTYIDGVNR
ncbi:MAG: hypothetical protein H0W23_00275 [Chloroflexia bacterium]|nr:hypothetical protein [Chloroflexia bacterium]